MSYNYYTYPKEELLMQTIDCSCRKEYCVTSDTLLLLFVLAVKMREDIELDDNLPFDPNATIPLQSRKRKLKCDDKSEKPN